METQSLRYPHVKSARMIELEEMDARGWGSVPQFLMPRDWRERCGPGGMHLAREAEEITDEETGVGIMAQVKITRTDAGVAESHTSQETHWVGVTNCKTEDPIASGEDGKTICLAAGERVFDSVSADHDRVEIEAL